MNDYIPVKSICDTIIKSINGYSMEQRDAYRKFGMDIISNFTTILNKNNTYIKLTRVVVSTSSLLLFATCADMFQSICNKFYDEKIFDQYLSQLYDRFLSYAADERFFDIEKIKMEIAVSGTIDSMYPTEVTSMFCNTAAVFTIQNIVESSIKDNEYEGVKFIQDYLNDNFLNNQWTISHEIMEFE